MAGGLAGVASWLVSYPFDTIKTLTQCNTEKRKITMKEIAIVNYREHGYQFFFKGLTPTVIRAFPVNAMTLTAFDYLSKKLQ